MSAQMETTSGNIPRLIAICPRCGTTALVVDYDQAITTGSLHQCTCCKWRGYHPDLVYPEAGWYGTFGFVGPAGRLPA